MSKEWYAFRISPKSSWVRTVRRIITTICEHIEADKVAIGVYIAVSIDKSLKLWVIVTAIEVVEAGFCVVVIATIAERGCGSYCLLRALRL